MEVAPDGQTGMGCNKEGERLPFLPSVAGETCRRLPSHLTMIAVHVGRYFHESHMQNCLWLKQHLVEQWVFGFFWRQMVH